MSVYKHRITVKYSQESGEILSDRYVQVSKANLRTPTTSNKKANGLVGQPSGSRHLSVPDGCIYSKGVLRWIGGPRDFVAIQPVVRDHFCRTTGELDNTPRWHFLKTIYVKTKHQNELNCLFIYLSMYLCTYLFIYLFIYYELILTFRPF